MGLLKNKTAPPSIRDIIIWHPKIICRTPCGDIKNNSLVVKPAKQLTVNQRVAGSSLASGAKAPHVRGAFCV